MVRMKENNKMTAIRKRAKIVNRNVSAKCECNASNNFVFGWATWANERPIYLHVYQLTLNRMHINTAIVCTGNHFMVFNGKLKAVTINPYKYAYIGCGAADRYYQSKIQK